MTRSDHSEVEEEDMDKLEISSDSTETVKNKRSRIIDSEDEDKQDLPAKKQRTSCNDKSEILNKNETKVALDKNGTNEYAIKEEKYIISENGQNLDKKSPFDLNIDKINEENQESKTVNQENKSENSLENKDNPMDTDADLIKVENKDTINKDDLFEEKSATNTSTLFTSEEEKIKNEDVIKEVDETINIEKNGIKERHIKNHTMDAEVIDGLELSVECASDKEESSCENEDEKDMKPRLKTIIVKAEPNESELECSSSEEEKSDLQEIIDTVKAKPEKKRGKKKGSRTSFSKMKSSESEESRNNSDEDYSPRAKNKIKKSPTGKRSKRTMESKRGRGGKIKKNSHKKNTEETTDDETTDSILVNRNTKTTKIEEESEDKFSEKESLASKSQSNSNSEAEDNSVKSRKRRSNSKPEDDKRIQMLKKYLNIAGVKVRANIWADCKSNAARIRRLKELLEKNGVSGRPTLEKCKRAREENEKMRELSELDTSNIISERRITRARRNMENKRTIADASPRHREARSTFKRIQTVVDSDSE